MEKISNRLRELTQPTGEEELLDVAFPSPRLHVPPWQACAVAVLLVAGVVVWMGRRPAPLEAVAEPTEAPREIVVSVVGEVDAPGLVTLASHARVADALAAARPHPDVNLEALNLAQVLEDGQQIVVHAPGADQGEDSGLLSLNAATKEQLTALSGVGEVTASNILAHREEIGGFSSVDQLLDVSGIGPAKFEKLKDQVRP